MTKKKTMLLGSTAAAVALLAGMGIAGVASASADSGTAPETTKGSTQSAPRDHRGPDGGSGHRSDDMVSKLAEKLGVDEAKLKSAFTEFRQANKPTEPARGTERRDHSSMDAALAKSLSESLGIEQSKVAAALEELRSAGRSERAAGLKSRLDAAVSAGTLSRSEAEAVTKAVEKGVIGGR